MQPIAQFKVRKVRGVTEIRMRDAPGFLNEFKSAFPRYAPLLDAPAPGFDELKSTPQAAALLRSSEVPLEAQLRIVARGKTILEKSVLFVSPSEEIRAMSSWAPGTGITFSFALPAVPLLQ